MKFIKILIFSLILFSCSSRSYNEKKIVLLIGDGMGFEQINSAELYNGKKFAIKDSALFSGSITTLNYSGGITDSAAGATAMATGNKVSNGVISMMIPGTGVNLETIFEYAKKKNYRTGLITTSYIIDATPAAFIAHLNARSDFAGISEDLLSFKPFIVIGGLTFLTVEQFHLSGYRSYSTLESYSDETGHYLFIRLSDGPAPYEYDQYLNNGYLSKYLSRASNAAVNNLPRSNPYIIMIEGGNIDHAGHAGLIQQNVFETNEFFDTAQNIYNRLSSEGNFLMIISADHETGGLDVIKDNGAGEFPDVQWTSGGAHTDREVPIFVYSDRFSSDMTGIVRDNTEIYSLMKRFIDY